MRGRIIQSVIHFIPCSSYSFHHSLPFFWTILLYPTSTLNPLFSSFFHPAPSPPPRYLRGIRRRVQSASLRDLQGRQEEQSGTKQRRTQHGSSDVGQEKNWSRRTENTQTANTQIYIRSLMQKTLQYIQTEYKIMLLQHLEEKMLEVSILNLCF